MSDFDARARSLFLALCEQSEDEQALALATHTTDEPALVEAVERMLAADRAASMTESRLAVGVGRRLIAESLARTAIPGQVGPYRVVEIIGEGGMGVVLRAEQDHPRRTVALKLPLLHRSTPAHLARFRAEAQALAELRHPAVPAIYEAGVEDEQAFLAMEYVSGEALHIAAAALPLRARVRLLAQLADGVAHAHARGVVHRDLKPSNVLVDADGAVHVVDFGLAVTGDAVEHAGGTPRYMAPELIAHGQSDPRADVYALGYVIWEIVMGRPAPDGGLPDLPKPAGDLTWIVRHATRADAAERYADADEVAAELRRWLGHRPVLAAPWRIGQRARLFARRSRRLLGVAAAVIAVAAAGWGMSSWRDARRMAANEQAAQRRLATMQRRVDALRARGESEAADAVFNAFVTLPEHAGTSAVTAAWLRRAERSEGGSAAAVSALAQAFATADDGQSRRAALIGLAHAFHARWAWGSLAVALDQLRVDGLDDDLRALARDAALMRVDLATAGRLEADPAWARLYARLASASPTPHRAYSVRVAPDGSVVLFDQHAGRMVVAEPAAELPVRAERSIPKPSFTAFGLPSARFGPWPTVVGWRDGQLEVFDLDLATAQLTLRTRQPLSEAFAAQWRRCGDHWSLVVGTRQPERALVSLDPADGMRARPTHPPSDRLASDVRALDSIDFDADGCEELVVGRGAWTAYEVTLYQQRDASAPLQDVAGMRLGTIVDVVALPEGRVAVMTDGTLFNSLAWADARDVPAIGLHLLRWDGHRLRREAHYAPLPSTALSGMWGVRQLYAGDLDGDGRVDLAVDFGAGEAGQQRTWLLRQRADGTFSSRILGGLTPLAVADLDGDGTAEIIARAIDDNRTWVLGMGTATPPVAAPPVSDAKSGQAPQTGEPALDRAAVRIEGLVRLGLGVEAAQQLRTLAEIATTTDARRILLARSAALLARAGLHHAALAQYAALPREGKSRAAILRGTLESQLALLRFHDALTTARAAADPRIDALAELVSSGSRVDVDIALPLDGWQVEAPHLMSAGPGGTLKIDAFSRREVLMRRPATLRSPAISLEFAADFERLEHASGLGVWLREPGPGGRVILGCRLKIFGGGDGFTEGVGCLNPGERRSAFERRAPSPIEGRRIGVRAAYRIDTHEMLFEVDFDGVRRVVRPTGTAVQDPPSVGQPLELVVVSSGFSAWPGPTRASARLERISLEGIEVRTAPVDPERAPSPALDALAHVREGRLAAAAAAIRDAPTSEAVLEVLRLHPEIALVERGEAAVPAVDRLLLAWRGALRHPELPDLRSLFRAPALAALAGETAHAREFMRAQAQHFLEVRQSGRARAVIERLVARDPDDRETVLLAARAFHDADPSRARRAARRFVELVGSPRAARAQLGRYGLARLLD